MTNVLRRAIVATVSCIALPGIAQGSTPASTTAAQPAPGCLRLFDGMHHRGKPDLGRFGIRPLVVAYVYNAWWGQADDRASLPPLARVTAWVAALRAEDRTYPLVIDLEHWPTRGSVADVRRSVSQSRTLLTWVRAAGHTGPKGFYALPPLRDYWRAVAPAADPGRRAWREENDAWQPLADASDVLFPSLYTFYEDRHGWQRYAVANLAEARRLARGRPVYAFLWPRYHDSNRTLGRRLIPADYWRLQLDTAARHADGAVIWGGAGESWDDAAAWWRETRAALAAHGPCAD
jgi:hypothetical protein